MTSRRHLLASTASVYDFATPPPRPDYSWVRGDSKNLNKENVRRLFAFLRPALKDALSHNLFDFNG
jgi:hypothetical protein